MNFFAYNLRRREYNI